MKRLAHCAFCSIVPPYMLKKMVESDNPRIRDSAIATLEATARAHQVRSALSQTINVAALAPSAAPAVKTRRVFDCGGTSDLSRTLVLQEGGALPADIAV